MVLTEHMGQMRARGAMYLAQGTLPPEGRATLQAGLRQIFLAQADLQRHLAKANADNAAFRKDPGRPCPGIGRAGRQDIGHDPREPDRRADPDARCRGVFRRLPAAPSTRFTVSMTEPSACSTRPCRNARARRSVWPTAWWFCWVLACWVRRCWRWFCAQHYRPGPGCGTARACGGGR